MKYFIRSAIKGNYKCQSCLKELIYMYSDALVGFMKAYNTQLPIIISGIEAFPAVVNVMSRLI